MIPNHRLVDCLRTAMIRQVTESTGHSVLPTSFDGFHVLEPHLRCNNNDKMLGLPHEYFRG